MKSLDQLKKVVIGNESTFLIQKNGIAVVSGISRHNKFGLKDKENKLKVRPYQAVDFLDIHDISTSSFHSLFTNKGEVYSEGLNMRGQGLGLGHNKPPYARPLIQNPELKHVKVKKHVLLNRLIWPLRIMVKFRCGEKTNMERWETGQIHTFYHFPTEDSHFKKCVGHSPMSKWGMNVGRR
ncbi:hypothetical protein [Brevibacillus laterosporus]|uniref:Uncharacterized protein n=1 Tax=Brevibacillus laterosporus TaxID=1465 RepID=A0AAP8QG54_BRELA|nr:hypothetical protein [Brevibacillus laterosporus]PPB08819.1 hypothetical protein C4A77_05890 [Brevibacillus laterosporus]